MRLFFYIMEPGHQRIPFDDNRKPFLTALSYVDGQTAVPLFADPATGHLLVTSNGGGGVTQYTEGATTSPAIGTVALGRYLVAPPGTLTDGQLSAPLLDNFGQLKVVPVGTSSTKITDGTNTANVFAGDSGSNGLIVGSGSKTVSFSTTTAQAVASTDAANYTWASVQITSQGGSSQITFQTSDDNTNWVSNNLSPTTATTSVAVGSSTTTGVWHGPIMGRYFRLNVTSIVSGTTSGSVIFLSTPRTVNSGGTSAVQSGAWTVGANSATGSSIPANAFSMGMSDGTNLQAIRTPSIFKSATATASGDTAVWTPSAGKKFRLMRYSIQVTADVATSGGGDVDIVLRDSTTATAASFSTYIPAVAGTTFGNTNQTGWVDIGNGILSAAANNVLNVNLSAALTSGKVRVVAIGTEE